MAPPVNKPGQPPDVTALIVSKETDVTSVLMVTMVTHVVRKLLSLKMTIVHFAY